MRITKKEVMEIIELFGIRIKKTNNYDKSELSWLDEYEPIVIGRIIRYIVNRSVSWNDGVWIDIISEWGTIDAELSLQEIIKQSGWHEWNTGTADDDGVEIVEARLSSANARSLFFVLYNIFLKPYDRRK